MHDRIVIDVDKYFHLQTWRHKGKHTYTCINIHKMYKRIPIHTRTTCVHMFTHACVNWYIPIYIYVYLSFIYISIFACTRYCWPTTLTTDFCPLTSFSLKPWIRGRTQIGPDCTHRITLYYQSLAGQRRRRGAPVVLFFDFWRHQQQPRRFSLNNQKSRLVCAGNDGSGRTVSEPHWCPTAEYSGSSEGNIVSLICRVLQEKKTAKSSEGVLLFTLVVIFVIAISCLWSLFFRCFFFSFFLLPRWLFGLVLVNSGPSLHTSLYNILCVCVFFFYFLFSS